jgi:tellurite resistance protein TerC
MATSIWFWVFFNLFVAAMLVVDLGVHRRSQAISVREAAIWSSIWVTLALLFNAGIYHFEGTGPALEFLTGYVIEKSLAIDNLFVFAVIFSYFSVPERLQYRVLHYGVLGALVMRGLFIGLGAFAVQRWHFVLYVFGAFLVITGLRFALRKEVISEPGNNRVVRAVRRMMPLTESWEGDRFLVRKNGQLFATPLFLVLLVIEATDLVFAVDSIPAIFAVTRDPYLVYTSNVFAILGLRAMYFLLAHVVQRFVYLRFGLAFVLVFIGIKMLLDGVIEIPTVASLVIVATVILMSIVLSLLRRPVPPSPATHAESPPQSSATRSR